MGGACGSERELASFTAACSSSGGCAAGTQTGGAGELSGKGRWLLPPGVGGGLGGDFGDGFGSDQWGSCWDLAGMCDAGGEPLLSLYSAFLQQRKEKPVASG